MPARRRAVLILAALLLLALASFWAALAAGIIPIAATDILAAVLGQDAPVLTCRQLRLPRALRLCLAAAGPRRRADAGVAA